MHVFSGVSTSRRRATLLKEPRVEGMRQEILELMRGFDAVEIGEDDFDVAGEFPQYLAAGAAGRRGLKRVGDNREALERSVPFGKSLENRDTLSAHGQPVGGVFDVTAG